MSLVNSEQTALALILFRSRGLAARGLLAMTWEESVVRSTAAALQCL